VTQERKRSQEDNAQEMDIQGLNATGDAVLYSKLVDCYDGHRNHVTEHIINICGFPDDSEIFQQEGWTEIADIAMLTMQEADGLLSTNSDVSHKAKPMNLHLC
jgi:hypothetical protein